MKPWLIAHRGAQSDGRENTLAAFRACSRYPLGWVELDVHITKDNIVVCHHDFDVDGLDIKTHSFKELQAVDPEICMFEHAVKVIDGIPIRVEIKPLGVAKYIADTILAHPKWLVSSYYPAILEEVADCGVDRKRLFLLQHYHSFWHIHKTLRGHYGGISPDVHRTTPWFIWRAHHRGLNIYVYTINSKLLARFYRRFFPYVGLCTNRPDVFSKLN